MVDTHRTARYTYRFTCSVCLRVSELCVVCVFDHFWLMARAWVGYDGGCSYGWCGQWGFRRVAVDGNRELNTTTLSNGNEWLRHAICAKDLGSGTLVTSMSMSAGIRHLWTRFRRHMVGLQMLSARVSVCVRVFKIIVVRTTCECAMSSADGNFGLYK